MGKRISIVSRVPTDYLLATKSKYRLVGGGKKWGKLPEPLAALNITSNRTNQGQVLPNTTHREE